MLAGANDNFSSVLLYYLALENAAQALPLSSLALEHAARALFLSHLALEDVAPARLSDPLGARKCRRGVVSEPLGAPICRLGVALSHSALDRHCRSSTASAPHGARELHSQVRSKMQLGEAALCDT